MRLYKLISILILIPLVRLVFEHLLLRGRPSLSNNEFLALTKSFKCILGLLLLSIVIVVLFFIEQGVLIIISEESYFNRTVSVRSAFATVKKKLVNLISIGIIPILFYVLLVIPFVGSVFKLNFLPSIEVPGFILDFFMGSAKTIILYYTFMFLLFYISFRWIFVIHTTIIENNKLSKAIKKSNKLSKSSVFKIIKAIALYYIAFSLIILGLMGVIVIFAAILSIIFTNLKVMLFGWSTLIVLGFIILILVSLVSSPLKAILITEIYYNQVKDKCSIEPTPIEIINTPSRFNLQRMLLKNKGKFLTLIIILIIICFIGMNFLISKVGIRPSSIHKVEVTGHRGMDSMAPENTKSGIIYAEKAGLDYAELDVQQTKDGVVVLTHDTRLKRIAKVNKNIYDLTYKDWKLANNLCWL